MRPRKTGVDAVIEYLLPGAAIKVDYCNNCKKYNTQLAKIIFTVFNACRNN